MKTEYDRIETLERDVAYLSGKVLILEEELKQIKEDER